MGIIDEGRKIWPYRGKVVFLQSQFEMKMTVATAYKRHSIRDVRLRGGIRFRGSGKAATASMKAIDVKMPKELAGMHFRMQVSAMDCTGCGNCADVCPAKEKALVMKPFESQLHEAANWDYAQKCVTYKDNLIDKKANVKNSQFAQPLFEFSGACAGCGETPYLKCITQLFGEQMMVANATGCSSIYGGSAPATPYCKNYRSGFGPAWANSLFEDNAEFGLGMATATRQMRDRVERIMKEGLACDCCSAEIKALFTEWIENRENTLKTKEIADKLIPLMEKCGCDICKQLLELRHSLVKKSQWIFGGDGWGYDIGFGGLDHVLASGEDVNVVVVDTEVYSNTGGQSSNEQNFQWTFCPAGAVAKLPPQGRQPQHATSGKKIRKTVAQSESRGSLLTMPSQSNVTESKDLGMIAKSYGYVYVAQVAMGASQAQYFCRRLRTPLKSKSNEVSNVIKEAFILRSLRSLSKVHWTFFTYHGPSLIICYAPCINHGIKIGMGRTQNEEKKAVECGYWHLWHYNPAEDGQVLKAANTDGKEEMKVSNGFHLDSKEPDWSKFRDFIMGEVRYNSLMKTFPQEAEELFVATERNAKLRYEGYKKLSEM